MAWMRILMMVVVLEGFATAVSAQQKQMVPVSVEIGAAGAIG
jgi:hypothetical protein